MGAHTLNYYNEQKTSQLQGKYKEQIRSNETAEARFPPFSYKGIREDIANSRKDITGKGKI